MEAKLINLWSQPKKIKENWWSAILEFPEPATDNNIQFIIKHKTKPIKYIIVSKTPLTVAEINAINLKDFYFEDLGLFYKGYNIMKAIKKSSYIKVSCNYSKP